MQREELEEIVQQRLNKIHDVLFSKNDEYNDGRDVFYNFKRIGKFNEERPREALWGMAQKHLMSIVDIVESGKTYNPEYIEEKIGDMINYLILLEGLLYEDWDRRGGSGE